MVAIVSEKSRMIRMGVLWRPSVGVTTAFPRDYSGLETDLLSSVTSFKLYHILPMTSLSELVYEWRTWY